MTALGIAKLTLVQLTVQLIALLLPKLQFLFQIGVFLQKLIGSYYCLVVVDHPDFGGRGFRNNPTLITDNAPDGKPKYQANWIQCLGNNLPVHALL